MLKCLSIKRNNRAVHSHETDYGKAICENPPMSSGSAGERADFQPQLHQRSSVCPGERQQAARSTEARSFTVFARFRSVELGQQFRRLKGHECIYQRFDKLNVLYSGFLNFALFVEMIYDLE